MKRLPKSMDEVLRAAARLQAIVPDAVRVGGTAAARYAAHRVSYDDDHVVADLRSRFDAVLSDLEATDGWITARIKRPVMILGSLDGIETGIRNLIRDRPLEVELWETPHGALRVPTLAEMLRIKAWLILMRNATRDYLDLVALAEKLGIDAAASVLLEMDDYYVDQQGPGGRRIATQLARQLAEPEPYDLSDVDLKRYRQLDARLQDWAAVADRSEELAIIILGRLAENGPENTDAS